jgi:hypothetical protein
VGLKAVSINVKDLNLFWMYLCIVFIAVIWNTIKSHQSNPTRSTTWRTTNTLSKRFVVQNHQFIINKHKFEHSGHHSKKSLKISKLFYTPILIDWLIDWLMFDNLMFPWQILNAYSGRQRNSLIYKYYIEIQTLCIFTWQFSIVRVSIS